MTCPDHLGLLVEASCSQDLSARCSLLSAGCQWSALGNDDAAVSTRAALTRNARKAAEGKRSELGSGIQIGAYKAVRRPRLMEVFPPET